MDKQDVDKIIAVYVKKLFDFTMSKLSKIDQAEELAAKIPPSGLRVFTETEQHR